MLLRSDTIALLAAASGGATPEKPAPSMISILLPVLAVTILMFWFQRRMRLDQHKRKVHEQEEHHRHRVKLSQTLGRILESRQPTSDDKPHDLDDSK